MQPLRFNFLLLQGVLERFGFLEHGFVLVWPRFGFRCAVTRKFCLFASTQQGQGQKTGQRYRVWIECAHRFHIIDGDIHA